MANHLILLYIAALILCALTYSQQGKIEKHEERIAALEDLQTCNYDPID